ncbi:hypothetical protein [Mesorhizobium sp. M1329]|uniref:hypothetical protein n=1 Tax=Mesorhizobium sp. M1329 TaxID=2957083 RepID=UPI00333CD24F
MFSDADADVWNDHDINCRGNFGWPAPRVPYIQGIPLQDRFEPEHSLGEWTSGNNLNDRS